PEAYLRDQELYLLEAVRFAANVEGLPESLAARDQAGVTKALASAVAVRKDLDVVAAIDGAGGGLVDYTAAGGTFARASGGNWTAVPAVRDVLAGTTDATGDKLTGLVRLDDDTTLFLVAGPVRTDSIVGAVVAGISADKLAAGAATRAGAGIALYDGAGQLMARSARGPRAGRLSPRL